MSMDRREFLALTGGVALGLKDTTPSRRERGHIDARTIANNSLIEADLCIVGAGAAGISLAMEWIGTPYNVVLLEGGGFEIESGMQDLYNGEIVGHPYYPLQAARIHAFGGTTGHWAGYCSDFDPIDFEERDWVPHSGWPITRAELDPYYERAHTILELGPYRYDPADLEAQDPDVIRMRTDEDVLRTKIWRFSPPTRFGTRYREVILGAPNVHLYTYANVVDIEANEPATAVTSLRVRTIDGKEHRVQARQYVLACGAIQNARLLLASRRQAPAGLGNDHDLVGRYFMEHFEMPSAHLVLREPQPMKMYSMDFRQTWARGELALTADAQRREHTLNATASLRPGEAQGELQSTFQVITPEFIERFRKSTFERGERAPTPSPERVFVMLTRQEQTPNPSSRIMLGEELDSMGMPRIKLDWQTTTLDRRSMRRFYEVIGREIAKQGLGEVRIMDWLLEPAESEWPSFLSGAWHHMGTTRMHDDRKQGVVDANSKAHGIANLSITGSGVFPTSGAANPTLSLVALSLRLSDHLKRTLR